MTDLSIAVVSYGDYEAASRLVQTIEHFTSPDIQKKIYLLDNEEAPYPQKEQFQELERKEQDVVYIPTGKNLGYGKANNIAIKRVSSIYHAIVNPDVILEEDSFSRLLSFMTENPDVGMCIPRLVDEQGNQEYACRREVTVWDMAVRMFLRPYFPKRAADHEMQDADYDQPFQVPFAQGSFLVARTELLQELGGFDERYFMYMEDADLCKRMNQISKVFYCPETTVIHSWGQGSHKNGRLFGHHLASMIKYFHKWGVKWC